jgi:uncharacterized LabA/DUF88 family protein
VATFVDAGWMLAAAALEVVGVAGRDDLVCDYPRLIRSLDRLVEEHCDGGSRLRTYWYDGGPGGLPTHEHDRVASLPYVKVRLGRLNRARQQKGVDVLIYHDLLTLARERAIERAYLVAGDEDLREGVAEAQKLGVQVVLLGMPVKSGQNQSARLVRECDECIMLPRATWEPFCSVRTGADEPPPHEDILAVREVGGQFAREWVSGARAGEAEAVLASFPNLPREVDVALLHAAEERIGSLRRQADLKSELRSAFWAVLKRAFDIGQALGREQEPLGPAERSGVPA